MAAPAFGSVGTHLFGSSATASFAVPASVASGDIIVIPIFIDVASVTISAMPSGFAHAEGSPVVGGSNSLAVVWKRATGADTGTYDFTLSSSTYRAGSALRYTGCVASGNPWDSPTSANLDNTNGTVTPSVNIDTAGPDRMLVFAATNWSGGAWTPPTGFTERFDTGDEVNTADDLVQAAQGNTGGVTATCVGNDKRIAWLGALIGTTVSGSVPFLPPRTPQVRDPGETWWIQRDLRDANTVGTSANPLPSPLDVAFGAGGPIWWQRGGAVDAAPRTWTAQQRTYSDPSLLSPPAAIPGPAPQRTIAVRDYGESQWIQGTRRDPLLLTAALLENELLGSVDDLARHRHAGVYVDRREVPQQRPYVSDPLLLASALLENELLGSADDLRRRQLESVYFPDRREVPQQRAYVSDPTFYPVPNPPDITTSAWLPGWLARNVAATHADRREVPQQRLYISDPSFYPTVAPTDPLTLAYGAGGTYWLMYNVAAVDVDRREVPQQRRYVSDPGLLSTALLEDALLGGATTAQRLTWFTDRREVPQQRMYTDPSLLAIVDVDPTTLAAGVGGDLWRRVNTPAYADRRETAAQPLRQTLYFDAGPGLPPLTLAWGAGGNLWHLYNPRRPARSWWPQGTVFAIQCNCTTTRPSTGSTGRPGSSTTIRPSTGITEDPCC